MLKFRLLAAGALALVLAACGDGGTPNPFSTAGTSGGSGGSGGTGGTGGTGSSPTYAMGNGSGMSFVTGVIAVSNASLSAGGTTSLDITIVDTTGGTLYNAQPVTITINSPCVSQGTATIAATAPTTAGASANTLVTSTGTASATYTAKGCSGSDTITATATVSSQSLSAAGTVTVAAPTIGSIQFISATPTTIGLKGTGIGSSSTVIFEVEDSSGAPVPGATVNFTLNTAVGGLSLAPASAISAANGQVQTVVSSGTVHTTVRVTATIASPAVSTQSSILTITTGLPASGSFTIAIGPAAYPSGKTGPACPNVEAYSYVGVQAPFTVFLADRYNNPAPDGTAVAFTTNAAHIVGNCTTPLKTSGDGACQVLWTSSNPLPQTTQDVPQIPADGFGMVLATALGEESFVDSTGSGFYVVGDVFSDLGEPYLDMNNDGIYEYPYEWFLDYYQTGKYVGPSGSFIGITCTGTTPASTCTENTLAIGALHAVVMSTSTVQLASLTSGGQFSAGPPFTIPYAAGGTITFSLEDLNTNAMAAGSVVTITTDSTIGTVNPNTSGYTMPCSIRTGGYAYTMAFTSAAAPSPAAPLSGNIYITVTAPGTGTITQFFVPVTVN